MKSHGNMISWEILDPRIPKGPFIYDVNIFLAILNLPPRQQMSDFCGPLPPTHTHKIKFSS